MAWNKQNLFTFGMMMYSASIGYCVLAAVIDLPFTFNNLIMPSMWMIAGTIALLKVRRMK